MTKQITMWRIALNNGNIYNVLAKSNKEAINILKRTVQFDKFVKTNRPFVRRIPNGEFITSVENGILITRTAKEWCSNRTPGLFDVRVGETVGDQRKK